MLQQFIMENVTPRKCLIVASGVQNHAEYLDLVRERLGELLPVPEHNYERSPSEYIGGDFRTWGETPATSITLAFEACKWQNKDIPVYYLMSQLLGSASAFSSGGPGKGMHSRAVTNLMQKHSCVDGASAFNSHFTDSGLFGMTIEGPGAQSDELSKLLVSELNGLREPID